MDWRFWFSFRGRMRRRDWWLTRLATWSVMLLMLTVAGAWSIFGRGPASDAAALALITHPVMLLFPIVLWVDIATCVRRLHDTGITGWAYLMVFIPFVGSFLPFIVMGCLDGTMGPNKFGPSPKFPDVSATGMIFE